MYDIKTKTYLNFLLLILIGCGEDIKIKTELYEDGNIHREFQFYNHSENNMRVKHGWYNSYYENGNYEEVGRYHENKKNGQWIYYTQDGEETIGYWENGEKIRGDFWINVKNTGYANWVETLEELNESYDVRDGNVYRGLFTFENSQRNGQGIVYLKDGNKKCKLSFEDGRLTDKNTWFNDRGGIEKELHFKEGYLHGKSVSYYENGEINSIENYEMDKLHGEAVYYLDRDDDIFGREVLVYEMGERKTAINYYKSGKVFCKASYEEDKLEESRCYYENGNIYSKYKERKKIQYNEDGFIESEYETNDNGLAKGRALWFGENGQLIREGYYKEYVGETGFGSYLDGKLISYDGLGNIVNVAIYEEGSCISMCE